MELNKSWRQITTDRTTSLYDKGVQEFLDFAFNNFKKGKLLRCPCRKYRNDLFCDRKVMYEHLIINWIKGHYVIWEYHGEVISEPDEFDDDDDDQNNCNDEVHDMLHDLGSAMNIENIIGAEEINYTTSTNTNSVNEEEDKFSKLLFIAEQELYPGCENFSKLSFIVQLLNIKCLFGLSGKAIDALLSLLAKTFPHENKVHVSY
ncbi:hypothetical protein JHK82_033609 [Glycine max]|uniref:Transposase-associated domain-containing protein n=2 Tax=Glycine subgen. Soja TaxID=1462606 RepID=A0A0R0H4J4_SOYBN|nr:hypothetical protein JHK85_034328 [Glycine max]KAG4985998.1 hypothetical protein JHK86_033689 [Glycine max]KAG5119189.1 hypothetical protein JHK82_033609 [Glycine max]KAG5140183.1 hypothetical protein JHK84_033951 [Glycine max]